MKLRIINIRQILFSLFFVLSFQYNLLSQGTDISHGTQQGLFVGISLGPSQSQIVNKGTSSVSDILASKKSSMFGFVDIGYFFSDNFGLSSGIGYTTYSTQLTLNTYQNKYNTTDSENDTYEMRISGTGIKEVQKISSLSIPVCINFRLPFNEKIGFFLQAGLNLAIPMSKSYTSSGTFSYAGYYPAYNVVLEDIPAYVSE